MLPPTRQEKKLGDLVQIKTGKKDANFGTDDGAYPFFTCGREIIKAPNYSFDTEAILIAGNGDVGACKYYKGKFEAYQRTYILDKFSHEVNVFYLFIYLNGFLSEAAQRQMLGSAIPYIKLGMLQNFKIPLPPLATQKAIVEKLDTAMQSIDQGLALIKQNFVECDALWQSSLSEVFSNKEYNTFGMGDETTVEILDGDRGSNYPKKTEFTTQGYCLFLNTSNVRIGYFDLSKLEFVSKERDELLRKGKTKKYDVILTTRGTIGNCAYIDDQFPYQHVRINSGMVILRPNIEKLSPQFLLKLLISPTFTEQTQKFFSGSAQPQLPIRVMKQINLPLPTLNQQESIVAHLDQVSENISSLRKSYQTQEDKLLELKASVLHDAFSGKLVE